MPMPPLKCRTNPWRLRTRQVLRSNVVDSVLVKSYMPINIRTRIPYIMGSEIFIYGQNGSIRSAFEARFLANGKYDFLYTCSDWGGPWGVPRVPWILGGVARETGNSKIIFLRKMRISRSSFVAGRPFFFVLCNCGVLVGRPNPSFEIWKKPEVEFFENLRPRFNGWFPRRLARKRYTRFSLNLAVRPRLSGGTTQVVPLPGIFLLWEFYALPNAKIRFSRFPQIVFLQ